MNWIRVLIYGVALWLIPFVVAFLLFEVRTVDRALFESLITVTAVVSAVVLTLAFFRGETRTGLTFGLALGFAWAVISIVLDLPIFLLVFQMSLAEYVVDIALTYVSIPAITTGIAVARRRSGS